jgi:sugar transferase (PEP-CTERM/EpsH1 system associated)
MRILLLTQRLPYAPNRGDRVRAYHELRVLASRHEVHVVSLVHDREEEGHAADLHGLAASVSVARVPRVRRLLRSLLALPSERPLTHALLDSPAIRSTLRRLAAEHPPDLVLAYCSSMVRYALDPPLAGIPFILDMVDVDSEKWLALSKATSVPALKRWVYAREARCLRRFEAIASQRACLTCVVNDREGAALRSLAGPEAAVEVLQNGVDVTALRPRGGAQPSSDVVFCGVMNYGPNEEAALWLAREVWPAVRAARPDARLVLVGTNPTSRLTQLPTRDASVVITGSVPDVRPYLWQAAVSAAPLQVARGVQNKVLEAVAAGLPAVITPIVAEGLPPEVMPACRVAAAAGEFAGALVSALALSPAERRAVAGSARLDSLGWERRLGPLMDAVERACGTAAAPGSRGGRSGSQAGIA